ncbi:MAG: glycerol-3-phosphate acyltransferase [Candidatus Pacebacteria bacterium]|nr:glycerol-3-phosphate acyltransferase [Candidatus Paceibacterota bacterium]
MMLNYIIVILISYLIGSFPTALIFNKLVNKIDPRKVGSKNLGALNTLRITSKAKGTIAGIFAFLSVFLIDAFKGAFSVWLAMQLIPENAILAGVLAAFFSILGHNYSILIKFDGGRGAATFLGILLFLNWRMFFLWLAIVLLFMLIFELFIPVKTKPSIIRSAISDQIIGRLFGEAAAVIPFYFIDPLIFYISLLCTPLIIIRHIDRINKQVKDYKK